MCDQLAKEKSKLEEDKKHIKQDLKRIQTEIAGNAHSMRKLEDKMENIEKNTISCRSCVVVSAKVSNYRGTAQSSLDYVTLLAHCINMLA